MEENIQVKEVKDYSIQDKRDLVIKIEKLSNLEQIEIFKLIKEETKHYTENLNGIFININILSNNTLYKIEQFMEYCYKQQEELYQKELILEKQKIEIYGDNEKDITNNENNEKDEGDDDGKYDFLDDYDNQKKKKN